MPQLKDLRFVCLDCEMTGLDAVKDRIIEIAACKFTLQENLDSFTTLVKPDCEISPEAFAVHHISADMLIGKPPIEQLLPQILEFIGNHIIVGHGIGHDIALLINAAERAQIPCKLRDHPSFDTLRLARLYGDSPNNSLENLAIHFNVPSVGAHRALADVEMNIQIFKHLVRKFRSTEEIVAILAKPIKMKFMPLGKHKGRLFSEIPIQYLQWAANMDFDQDLLFSIRSELKRRRQGGGFSEGTNPFASLS